MSSTTSLTGDPSLTVETILFGSLVTAEVTISIVASTALVNSTASISSRPASITPEITSPVIMSTASANPSATPSASASSGSGLSKHASIGIGVGLAVAVLLIICGLLWFFSFHKRYQEDVDELEIGPNGTDYRRKAASIDALSSRPPTNHDALVGVQHMKSGSKSSNEMPPPIPEAYEKLKATTPRTSTSRENDPYMRRDGFF